MVTHERTLSLASHPFDKGSADAILASSDHIAYRVHTQILSEWSDFFQDLFSLPQPTTKLGTRKDEQLLLDGLPTITVSESGETLDTLLRFCYSVPDPTFTQLDKLRPVLEAAVKYDMAQVVEILKWRLEGFVDQEPLRVYCIACQHGFERIASAAAREVHRQEVQESFIDELGLITPGVYNRLLLFCKVPITTPWRFCIPLPTPSETHHPVPHDVPHGNHPASISALDSADVILRSRDGVDFQAHAFLLRLASPHFEGCLEELEHAAEPGAEEEKKLTQRLALEEDSWAVSRLLEFIYPARNHDLSNVQEHIELIALLRKYGMDRMATHLTTALWALDAEPLLIFLLAMEYNLSDQAARAACASLEQHGAKLLEYHPAMDHCERISGDTYFRLLKHYRDFQSFVTSWSATLLPSVWKSTIATCPDHECNLRDTFSKNFTESIQQNQSYRHAATSMETLYTLFDASQYCCCHPADRAALMKFSRELACQLEAALPKFDPTKNMRDSIHT
ncbi:hypothetical protein OBBRIDRAFT_886942 [Obba rivulosa]|uniref:BTB domain-containing protein n=1 Tax=Obba rivulosa TaxID=1052685 RepID=A0A8E2B095_9APHY|nr:hypothetical protein OBBRIDRAFT_886942 [Obba rivulosa]